MTEGSDLCALASSNYYGQILILDRVVLKGLCCRLNKCHLSDIVS